MIKHPIESEFETAVSEAGVNVTFKPTNSIYSFYRLTDNDDIARLGLVSPGHLRHAGPSGDPEGYAADEVQDMAERIASEAATSAWSIKNSDQAG